MTIIVDMGSGLIGLIGSYATHESNRKWPHGYRKGADRSRCIPKS
jgi:hypothetical protein